MLDTFENVSLTTIMVVVGPIMLALAIAYGAWAYRRRSLAMKVRAESTTKEIYRSGAEQERRAEGPTPGPMPR